MLDGHLTLRIPTQADAAKLFEEVDANRAYLRKWLNWLDHFVDIAIYSKRQSEHVSL